MRLSILLLHRSKLVFSWLTTKRYKLNNLKSSKYSLFETGSGDIVKTYKEGDIFFIRILDGNHVGLYTEGTFPISTLFYPLIKSK